MQEQTWYLVDNDEDEAVFVENGILVCGLSVKLTALVNTNELYKELELALPDLILLDVQLPGESGIECLAKLKLQDNNQKLRVVIVTNQLYQPHVAEAQAAGAQNYIVKPLLLDDYYKMINYFYYLNQEANSYAETSFVLDFSKNNADLLKS